MATIEEVSARVAKGAAWLAEHDPKGIFFLWYDAGISPRGRLPALVNPEHHGYIEGRAENYAKWCQQYEIWKRLYAELERLEKAAGSVTWEGST